MYILRDYSRFENKPELKDGKRNHMQPTFKQAYTLWIGAVPQDH